MACDNCGGGDRNIHLTNPDPAVTEVVVDGNIVLHPQPGTPYSWCIHDLRNVFDQILDYEGLLPFVWDPENCIAGPGRWPCPIVEHWDSTFIDAPQPDQCGDCDSGQWAFWVDDAIGLVTHVCIDGELVELGGQGGGGGSGDCCTPWAMVDGACNPVLVVKTSTGWRFYDEDLTSIARPQTLAWPESCAGEGCPTCWDISQAADGTVTIVGDDETIVIDPPETATACPNCVELVENPDGSIAVIQSAAADLVIAAPYTPPDNQITVTSGGTDYTGTMVGGVKVVADQVLATTTSPEVDYPPADFPLGWEQIFSDPLGESTVWVRLNDSIGPVWKQITN